MAKHIRVIGINSSPRTPDGPAQQESSTRTILSHALKHISRSAETELVDLVNYRIIPSAGCYSTDENLNHSPCEHYKDDFQQVLFEKFAAADGIIFSSPVYWLGASSRLVALFERLTEMDSISRDPQRRLLQGKVAGAIATAHVSGSAAVCYEILTKANYLGLIIPPHAFAFHTAGQLEFTVSNKENLKRDFVAFRNAEMVAENVYKMCNLIRSNHPAWTIYYELVHPASTLEKGHLFDYTGERKRHKDEDFRKQNRLGRI